MAPRIILSLAMTVLAAFESASARATSNHEYGKDEYAVIRDGLSPNKQMSLASHGEGELGDENFRVWLMAEPAHSKIVVLPDISPDNNLDTAPDAYHAFWSKDARHVAVAFRSSRHEVTLNLYSLEGRRVRPIGGPSLFKEVTSRDVTYRDDVSQSISGIDWRGDNRFVLREFRTFVTSDAAFLRLLGAYGHVAEKLEDGRLYVQFAAEADCLLLPDHHTRVIDIRPANPDHPPDW
jgi:hypothetical protein